jgi:hypothetical protein
MTFRLRYGHYKFFMLFRLANALVVFYGPNEQVFHNYLVWLVVMLIDDVLYSLLNESRITQRSSSSLVENIVGKEVVCQNQEV